MAKRQLTHHDRAEIAKMKSLFAEGRAIPPQLAVKYGDALIENLTDEIRGEVDKVKAAVTAAVGEAKESATPVVRGKPFTSVAPSPPIPTE